MINRLRNAWFKTKELLFLRQNRDRSQRFGEIYRKRLWKNPESASGFGSTLAATEPTRKALADLIRDHSIGSILDAPCGDFNWMSHLEFAGDYTGLDIVPELIAENNRLHGNARRHFAVGDIVLEDLPFADLVMCRECLNHLPLGDGKDALEHLAKATRKLLLVTHYPQILNNAEQPASFRFRSLNLTLPPFNLRQPDHIIDESHFEAGKVLGVWDVSAGSVISR